VRQLHILYAIINIMLFRQEAGEKKNGKMA